MNMCCLTVGWQGWQLFFVIMWPSAVMISCSSSNTESHLSYHRVYQVFDEPQSWQSGRLMIAHLNTTRTRLSRRKNSTSSKESVQFLEMVDLLSATTTPLPTLQTVCQEIGRWSHQVPSVRRRTLVPPSPVLLSIQLRQQKASCGTDVLYVIHKYVYKNKTKQKQKKNRIGGSRLVDFCWRDQLCRLVSYV